MPRDLSDVLHYLLPEAGAPEVGRPEPGTQGRGRLESVRSRHPSVRSRHPAPTFSTPSPALARSGEGRLPIVAVPIAEHDVVRAAFTWNLAVEVARLGARAVVIAPEIDDPSPLWPEAGVGPLGAELQLAPLSEIGALYRAAVDVAVSRADGATAGGLVLVRVPREWLKNDASAGTALLRWVLCFSTTDPSDLHETYDLAGRLLAIQPSACVGITLHGARKRQEAERAFAELARATREHLAQDLTSYGLLLDDLDVYRAIVARRPIGLAHPRSAAARALRDVAELLLQDARKHAVSA